jgi:hypothetical protein
VRPPSYIHTYIHVYIHQRGPGTPERTLGQFVWLSSIRYIILDPWLVKILSLNMLDPMRGSTTVRLNPAFCPSYADPTSVLFNQRLIQIRRYASYIHIYVYIYIYIYTYVCVCVCV